MDEAYVVAEGIAVGMILIVVNIVAGKAEPSCDAEARERRSIATVGFNSRVAIREVRIPDSPDIHNVCRYAKRVHDVGTDQIRVAQRQRSGDAVQTRSHVQYVVRR